MELLVADALSYWETNHHDLLALDEALARLGEEDDTLQRVVELRFFAGLTLETTGQLLGMTLSQTHRAWNFARAWLRRELQRGLEK